MKALTQTALLLFSSLLADESVFSSALASHRQDSRFKRGLFSLPLSTGAACLDGSPYAFTIEGENPKQWTIWLGGGGECFNETLCEDRSRSAHGSSKFLVSDDAHCRCMNYDETGKLLDCTCVNLLYCDGGYYAGHLDEPFLTSSGTELMIRGRRNLEASLDALLADHGLANARDLVITGSSSGGLATFLRLDSIAARMPPDVQVHGVPQSGFTVDHKTRNNEDYYVDKISMVFNFHNSIQALSSECLAEYHDSPWLCMVVSHAGRFIKTPLFVLNSKYDAWQLTSIFGLSRPAIFKEEAGIGALLPVVRDYGGDFMEAFDPFMRESIQNERHHGAFIQTCICHEHCEPTHQDFQGTSMREFLGRWYRDHGEDSEPAFYIEQNAPNYNCSAEPLRSRGLGVRR